MGRTALLAAALVLAATAGETAGDPVRGRELAERLCGRCHAWDPEAPWNSIGSTPSFMWMARRMDFYRERILSVTSRLPHIALRFEVTVDDLEDIAAYIETLRPQPREVAKEEKDEPPTEATAKLRAFLKRMRAGDGAQ